jgi:hypothetical protein
VLSEDVRRVRVLVAEGHLLAAVEAAAGTLAPVA